MSINPVTPNLQDDLMLETIKKAKLDTANVTFAKQVLEIDHNGKKPANETLEGLLNNSFTFTRWFEKNTDVCPDIDNPKFGLPVLEKATYKIVPFGVNYEVEKEVFYGEFSSPNDEPGFFFAENFIYDDGTYESYIYFNVELQCDHHGYVTEKVREQLTEKVTIVNVCSIIDGIIKREQEECDMRVTEQEEQADLARETEAFLDFNR